MIRSLSSNPGNDRAFDIIDLLNARKREKKLRDQLDRAQGNESRSQKALKNAEVAKAEMENEIAELKRKIIGVRKDLELKKSALEKLERSGGTSS